MRPVLSVLTPQSIATQTFTDASAAVGRLEEIYERNTGFLRDHFEAYLARIMQRKSADALNKLISCMIWLLTPTNAISERPHPP